MNLHEAQQKISDTYGRKDRQRGVDGTFLYLIEEIGELATALRVGDKVEQGGEFADVQAWLLSLASLAGVDMQEALNKYGSGCCGCKTVPCSCVGEKP